MRNAKGWMWAVLASATVVLSAGCGGNEDTNTNLVTDTDQHEDPLTLTDAQIARVAQVANEGEVMLGELGQARATDPAVRDFNTRMVSEHTAVLQRLNQVLQAQGIQPEDSPVSLQLQEEVQRLMAAVERAPADKFDLAMMEAQLTAHARTALTADAVLAPQAQNAALVQELTAERQSVQAHLREAATLQSTVYDVVFPPPPQP
ncbi:DUF4142 domain-containing protein [Pyxidicoccus sp. 3LG]